MGRILNVYLDHETHQRLLFISKELGRSIDNLADCSVSEAALNFFRGRNDDPAKKQSISERERDRYEREDAHRDLAEDDMPGGFN